MYEKIMIPSAKSNQVAMANVRPIPLRPRKRSWCRKPVDVPFHSYSPRQTRITRPLIIVPSTRPLVHWYSPPPSVSPTRNKLNPPAKRAKPGRSRCPIFCHVLRWSNLVCLFGGWYPTKIPIAVTAQRAISIHCSPMSVQYHVHKTLFDSPKIYANRLPLHAVSSPR